MRIDPIIRNLAEGAPKAEKTNQDGLLSFAEQLKSKIGEVDQLQHRAEESMAEGAVKGASGMHETMLRIEEAELGLRLLTRVRTKAIDAYQELMRMQF